ncbi:bzip transcription factor [Ophiostoma piceae UAMH 11346]|uniref:Bzip transcription factor n=1 Tax=Ophiostoma piceae (strain UAMH 11346) TaxID=1262450 RepID=S3C5H4_OPHP1|nr:bzip transcription factor [Ophiostoma piceae UAMH 11346]
MQADLPILNAMQYDTGIPRMAPTKATRGSKRKDTASTPRTLEATDNSGRHGSSHTLASMAIDDSVAPEYEMMESSESNKKKLKRPAKPPPPLDSDDGEGDGDDGEHDQEGGKKRARGRPRIDIKDVTAADIRLAQRAYRNRKERAIVSLEKKVQALKDANEAMSNAFMRLHDFAVARGLLETNPDLASQLRQTTEIFLDMARQSSADEDEDEEDDACHVPLEGRSKTAAPTTTAPSTVPPPPGATEAVDSYEKRQRSIADAVMTFGYLTQQAVADRSHAHTGPSQPPEPPQQIMVPPLLHTRHVHGQAFSGMPFQQPLHLSARSYVQNDEVSGSFGMAIGALDSMGAASSEPSASGAPSYYSHIGSDSMANMASTSRSSNNSAVSLSPGAGVQNYDFTTQLGMVSSPMSSYPPYGSSAMPTSTAEIAPHLADTHEFMSTAAIGSPSTLPLPTRYPVNVPFGLRLRRQSIQAAYNLITAPDPPPEHFARVFGFCIMFEQVGQIRHRLRRGLESPIHYNSKFNKWELPYVTQTPDPEGEAYAPASDRCQGQNNSNSDHRGTNVRPVVPLINITLPGFEGAFFDCEEIEMYLQQRGVHIPPDTHNVIVEVDDSDFVVGGTSTSTADRGSHSSAGDSSVVDSSFGAVPPPAPSGRTGYVAPDLVSNRTATSKHTNPVDWNLSSGPNILGTITAASGRGANSNMSEETDMMASLMNMSSFVPFQAQNQQHSPATFPQRRLLTLDVDRFLSELVRRASCLGQTPGFREADVNEAFWRSTQSAS